MPLQEEYLCVRCGISPYAIQERNMKYRTYTMSHPVLISGQVAVCNKCGHIMRIPFISEHNRILAESVYSSGQVYIAPLKSTETDKISDSLESSETDDELLNEEITVEDIERISEEVTTTSILLKTAGVVEKRKRGRPRKVVTAAGDEIANEKYTQMSLF